MEYCLNLRRRADKRAAQPAFIAETVFEGKRAPETIHWARFTAETDWNRFEQDGPYDYIHAVGCLPYPIVPGSDEIGPAPFVRRLTAMLKPGGRAAVSVYGYAGYYGPAMLNRMLMMLMETTNMEEALRICPLLVKQLPPKHPALSRADWVERLRAGDADACAELLQLAPEVVFSVSGLMEALSDWGVEFAGWLLPECYAADAVETSAMVRAQIDSCPPERRYCAVEMVGATPPEHHFLFTATNSRIHISNPIN